MPDTDPYLVPKDPAEKIRSIAQQAGVSPDIADDFSKVTGLESGRSHYGRNGQVKVSPVDPKDGQRAIGFSQIKPSTARSVGVTDPYDEEQNITAGLRYYAQGGNDPVRRRIAYFSGQNSKAVKYYDRTGKIPGGGDFTGTSFSQYIAGTGGGKQSTQDPYLVPKQQTQPAQQSDDPYLVPKQGEPVAVSAFKELNQQPRTRPKKSILSAATGGMGGGKQDTTSIPSYLSVVAPSIAQQLPAQRKLASAHFQQLKNQQDLAAQGGQMSMTSRKNDDELRSQAEDLANKELVDRPKIDALKEKFSSVAGKNTHVGRAVNSVWNALAGTNVQVGNVIQGVTGGRRGGSVVEDARLAQQALAELDQEDPDKGWLAAGEKVLPGAAIEAGKMTMGQRVLGAATLPTLGALSEADKGIFPAATAAGEGYLYHKGLGLTESMGPAGRFLTGTSVPAAVSIARGEDPKTALLSNTAYGAMALAGGRPKEGEAPQEGVQTVPEPLQAKLRGAEIGKTIDESIAAKEAKVQPTFLRDDAGTPVARVLNPEEVAAGAKPKIRPIHQSDTQVRDEVGKFAATEAPQISQSLPPSSPDTQRRVHGTTADSVDGIFERGLNYKGNISSTTLAARDWSPSDIAKYTKRTGPDAIAKKGDATVIVDLPKSEAVRHDQNAGQGIYESGTIPSKYIVGAIIDGETFRPNPNFAATEAPTEQPNTTVPQSTPEPQPSAAVSPSQPLKAVESPSSAAKSPGERSFPKTLASTGRESGTDKVYDVVGDKEAVAKADQRIKDNPESAKQFVLGGEAKPDSPQGKERIATGLRLADRLATEAEKSTDKVESASKHAQAIELYDKLSSDLTEAGQTVQAASLAKKYSREGAPLEVVRIAKANGATPKAEDVAFMRERAKKDADLESKLADIQKQLDEMKAKGATVGKAPKARIPALADRFAQMEATARANLEARAQAAREQTVGPRGQRGAAVNPVDVAASIKDWTVIGASKIARGGLNFASWSAEMIKDFGEEIRPHLNRIFTAAHKMVGEERLNKKGEAESRAAAKAGMSVEDLRQRRYETQVAKRQNRADMDRKFRDLEKRENRTTFQKAQDIAGTYLTGSLLSYHGVLNLLETMTAKEVLNSALRIPESAADLAYRGAKRLTGKQVPRASSGLSLKQVGGTAKYLATEGPKNIGKAFMGKPSDVMPEAREGPFDNQAANLAIALMPRTYAAKEAYIRSIAHPMERQNQASIMARNDITDGVIKQSQLNARINDYLNGRASVEGKLNKQYVASLADKAADYEIQSKNPTQMGQITKGAKAARVKQLTENPTQLIDSLALQYADRESYANPLGPKMKKIQEAMNAGGPVPRALIQPFFKRPVNAFNDLAYNYSGLRAVKEGGTAAIRGLKGMEWTPAERQSFNQAFARGGAVYALPALGAALASRGLLTSQNDEEHPSSLKIGGKYYAIGNKPVIGWLIAAGATAKLDGAKAVPKAIGQMVMDHPLMRGAKSVVDAGTAAIGVMQGKQSATKALSNVAGKQLGRLSPTPVAATAETMDTQTRDTRGLTAPLRSRLPFLREGLPAEGPKERFSAFDPNLPMIPLKPRPTGKSQRLRF